MPYAVLHPSLVSLPPRLFLVFALFHLINFLPRNEKETLLLQTTRFCLARLGLTSGTGKQEPQRSPPLPLPLPTNHAPPPPPSSLGCPSSLLDPKNASFCPAPARCRIANNTSRTQKKGGTRPATTTQPLGLDTLYKEDAERGKQQNPTPSFLYVVANHRCAMCCLVHCTTSA